MKYEEQPIDDSKGPEQFKVDDRVRVYRKGDSDYTAGNVAHVGGYALRVTYEAVGQVFTRAFHWKQCRLLKEEEPFEIKFCKGCKKQIFATTTMLGGTEKHGDCEGPFIRMREILE